MARAVLARLRADPVHATIQIVFQTAVRSSGAESDARQAGANDFVTKPINPGVLRSRVSPQLALLDRGHDP